MMFDPTNPGWKTTEALLVVAVLAFGNTVFHHQLDREKVLGTLNLVAPIAYVASRTIVKVVALWRGAVPVTALPTVTTPHPPAVAVPTVEAPELVRPLGDSQPRKAGRARGTANRR